jgi:hypothetical protein
MKTKGQKGFAIVNIIVGVILVMAAFAMFGDPSVGPGGIISLALGGAFWSVGAWSLSTLKKHIDDEDRVKKACRWNRTGPCVPSPSIAPSTSPIT